MVNLSVLFTIASSLTAFAFPTADSTVSQIEASLITLQGQLSNMHHDLQNFPDVGGSLRAALGIHRDGVVIGVTLHECTNEANDIVGVINDGDADALLGSVEGIIPLIQATLQEVVAKKAAFEALPLENVPKLVKQDLETLDEAAIALGVKFNSICPDEYKSRAIQIKIKLHNIFAAARAAYA